MKLTRPAFFRGTPLPDRFAREHGNISPLLTFAAWIGVGSVAPAGARR